MTVFVNGKRVDQISVHDRGLLYGQTLFETIGIVNGQARLLDPHLERLRLGCESLDIDINFNDLRSEVDNLLCSVASLTNSVLRVTISMGEGGRGYANPDAASPTRILSLQDYPSHPKTHYSEGIELGLSQVRLTQQPLLAGIKHGNRLEQILARSQWHPDWQEAILCDSADNVIEGTQSNLIIINGRRASTPLLDRCGVDGVMKNWALERLKEAGFSCQAVRLSVQDIKEADEVLLTNSIIGVWPVKRFESTVYDTSLTAQRLTQQLHNHEIIPRP